MKSEEFATAFTFKAVLRFIGLRILVCAAFFILHSSFFIQNSFAQFNTDKLVTIGRAALYYEDYVLSIQYFNQAIASKPYLYEPWFFRGVAKFYLDDFAGAERDCTEALQRNPYVVNIYELRGLTRIRQEKFGEAINDYTSALKYDPENRNLWHNRVLCHIENKEYDVALAELDTILTRWSRFAQGYSMKASIFMHQKDTTQAEEALKRSLEIDPYDGQTWAARSQITLARKEWEASEQHLNEALRLMPRHSGCYINRALARLNQNNLRGAMADYDMALDIEPNNFLGHYNRGLLRAQVGDNNRAITDFDFVLQLEPENMLALFNRAVLLDKTGDLKAAIRDYTKVIDVYPNFWTGLEFRAACYRKLGMTAKAEADEFTVYKARLYKQLYGIQPRLSPDQMRKRGDEDLEKYNQIVVEDVEEEELEYQTDYRGRVQNHKVDVEYQPMYGLSFEPQQSEVKSNLAFDRQVEELNQNTHARTLYINNTHRALDDERMNGYFTYIDSLTTAITYAKTIQQTVDALFYRAIAYSVIQNFDAAIDDLSTYLQIDSTSVLALWQRAACQSRINQFQASEGTNIELKTANVQADLNHALALSPQNAYLLYDRGNLYAQRQDYTQAIADYSQAITLEPNLAEAYYNRGLCLIHQGNITEGITDLSKAGELGLYTAYSLIKKYRKQ